MRRKILYLFFIINLFLVSPTSATSVNDFYFDSFDADYYLSKDEEGIATLKVIETLTAVFPNYDQNHGITREIPRRNFGGKNITVESKSALNLSVTRNGNSEPFSIEETNNSFNLRIGSADSYVHDKQIYVLSYEFRNVVTDFETYQELYWDTNGTGWYQPFKSLAARIHLDDDIKNFWSEKSWCYVGAYNSNDQSRCETNLLSDGVEFKTENLSSGENLTFDLKFGPDSFIVNIHEFTEKQSVLNVLGIILPFIPIFLYLTLILKSFGASKENRNLIKNHSVTPEYIPPHDLKIAEAHSLFSHIKPVTSNAKVATLIELAINRKIKLIKSKPTGILKHQQWQIQILSLDGLTESEKDVLKILKNSTNLAENETIEIRSHSYSSAMQKLDLKFTLNTTSSLKEKLLLTEQKHSTGFIAIILFFNFLLFTLVNFLFGSENSPFAIAYILLIFLSTIFGFVALVLTSKNTAYAELTSSGVEKINYLNGLKYYISLAETDRIKFLQSVENIDTSPEGIVNLYEKLLPYAIIFGFEKSWLAELNRYYEISPSDDRWFYGTPYFHVDDFNSFRTSAVSDFTSSTASSDSSSSSGSGGGGFSGGGGGGGGGGGW